MKLFQSISTSISDKLRVTYNDGVRALQADDHYLADRLLREAAEMGHPSAFFNLSILHASGLLSPYDIDFATECRLKAAEAGHATAASDVQWIQAADRGGFGTQNLTKMASTSPPNKNLSPLLMICACRYYRAVSDLNGATRDVLFWELAGLRRAKDPSVAKFVKRTGIHDELVDEHEMSLEIGVPDQITDGIHDFIHTLKAVGNSDRVCLLAHCTLVGYIASHSEFGDLGQPLLGVDKFFS